MLKEAFPKSMKELSVEQSQLSVDGMVALSEGRAGALASKLIEIVLCKNINERFFVRYAVFGDFLS